MKTAATASDRWNAFPARASIGPLAQLVLVGGAAFFVYLVAIVGGGAAMAMLAIGATAIFVVWRWPFVGLMALVVFGPPHQFLMVLVLHFSGSAMILKAAQLWKDAFLAVLLARAIDRSFRRKQSPTVYLLDLGIVIFLAMSALYLLFPNQLEGATLLSKLLGLRADTFFLLAYFVGRGLALSRQQVRLLLLGFALMSVIIAVVAVAQFVAPGLTNLIFDQLGLAEFTVVQAGLGATSVAVRENNFGGFVIPRASSLVLSDLALGFYTLLAAPLAGALFLHFPRLRNRLVANALLLAIIGTTFLTVTRSAIIALAPSLGTIFFRARGFFLAALVLVELGFAVAPVAYKLNVTPDVIRLVVSPDEGSIQGHLRSIQESVQIIKEHPLGRGLGTSGQVAQVTDVQGAITNEDWYLQIATEIGIAPAVVFALIVLGFGVVAFQQYGRVGDPWVRALCLGMGGATIGFGLVGISLHVWEAQTISIVFWLFAGIVARAPAIDRDGNESRGGTRAHRGLA